VLQKEEKKQFKQSIEYAIAKYNSNLDKENKDPRLLVRLSATGLL
jgi:hypothetical protein